MLKWFCVSFIKVSEHRKLLALFMVHWVELRQNVDPQTGGDGGGGGGDGGLRPPS